MLVSGRVTIFFVERYFLILQDLVLFFNLPVFPFFARAGNKFGEVYGGLVAGEQLANPWFPWRFFSKKGKMFFQFGGFIVNFNDFFHIITYPCFFLMIFPRIFVAPRNFVKNANAWKMFFFSDASCMPPPKPLATQQVGRVFTPEMSTPT